jgi:hypothetical protein
VVRDPREFTYRSDILSSISGFVQKVAFVRGAVRTPKSLEQTDEDALKRLVRGQPVIPL